MARRARGQIARADVPGTYHLSSRCVRRAFLMGTDSYTGIDYNHRRLWVDERLKLLVANFGIDVAFTASLSNHLHLVVRTYPRMLQRMSNMEVARRWLWVFPGKRVLDGNWIKPDEKRVKALAKNKKLIKKLRRRLSDISWFMSALSEYIARRSNKEDEVTGRFWEGRFKSRCVSGENALLICGLYVDLNPVRAAEYALPEDAPHTSVAHRIACRKSKAPQQSDDWLAEFTRTESNRDLEQPSASGRRATDQGLLPISLDEYLQILDCVGRQERPGKRGKIPENVAPILERLGIKADALHDTVVNYDDCFADFVASADEFSDRAKETGAKFLHGRRAARRIFE